MVKSKTKGYVIAYNPKDTMIKQSATIWLNKKQAQSDLKRYAYDEKDRNLGITFQKARVKEIYIPMAKSGNVYVKDDDNILSERNKNVVMQSDWEKKRIYNVK